MGYYAKRFFGKKIEEPRDPDFVFTVDCRSSTSYQIWFRAGPKDVVIDWGNGKTTRTTSDRAVSISANYNTTGWGGRGIYQIRIKGSFPGIYPNPNYVKQILSLDQWGTNEFTTMNGMFRDAMNMEANYTDSPNTQNVTDMQRMFYECRKFNGEVNFDTQNVTNMYLMFGYCWKFVMPVKFDTSSVTNIASMFAGSGTPIQSFASWDVTNLTNGTDFIGSGKDINEPGNTDNYDNTLISWASQDIQVASPTLDISFGSSKYSSRAKSARDFLRSKNWKITDGGMI